MVFFGNITILFQLFKLFSEDFPSYPCTLYNSGQQGQCVPITDCSEALYKLNILQVTPQTCGFFGLERIVCCPQFTYLPRKYETTHKPVDKRQRTKTIKCDDKLNVAFLTAGMLAEKDEFAHMVALGFENDRQITFSCGGTLLSDKFVLTAAHCTHHKELGSVKIARLGTTDLIEGTDYKIVEIFRHPNYKPPLKYNDIALLQLDNTVIFSNSIRPACLNLQPTIPTNMKLTAIGWGSTYFGGPVSTKLMKVDLFLYPHNYCRDNYRNYNKYHLPQGIDDFTQICALDDENKEKDTCQGDSGGPIGIKSDMYIIVGITSFGRACGKGIPGVYTKVSSYVSWIETIVWP